MRQGSAEILNLTFASFMGTADEEQMLRLYQLIESDAEARSLYLDFILLFTHLHRRKGLSIFVKEGAKPVLDPDLVAVLLEQERCAPTVESLKPAEEAEPPAAIASTPKQPAAKVTKIWPLVALSSMAAMVLILVGAQIVARYRPVPVATLYDHLGARWDQGGSLGEDAVRLTTNADPFTLASGLVKLHFDNHAQLVLEAPARFEILEGDHLRLDYGRLYATIPPQAIGFLVSTPSATVMDLGTEFGVHSNRRGDMELHVTFGKTELFTGAPHAGSGLVVNEGAAKKVDRQTRTIVNTSLNSPGFVHDFNSTADHVWRGEGLDLEDIVLGGDGLGDNLYSPLMVLSTQCLSPVEDIEIAVSDGYQTVKHPFIDGIFVPEGSQGPVQVSTSGHVFRDCPSTSGRSWFKHIEVLLHKVDGVLVDSQTLRFAGRDYRHPEHRALVLHASGGVTFDLDAIRASLPDRTISRFSASIGLSESLKTDLRLEGKDLRSYEANFYILIDGELRDRYLNVTVLDSPQAIDLSIVENERYLTLVTTGNQQDKNNFLWCFFAEPVLHLR